MKGGTSPTNPAIVGWMAFIITSVPTPHSRENSRQM